MAIPSSRLNRVALLLVAPLAFTLAVATAPPAAAATYVTTFSTIDSTPVGCSGARITAITEKVGVRYYYQGHRLHFPTAVLPFNASGHIELTAKAKAGYVISQTRGRVFAPSECFTALEPSSGGVGYEPIESWCTGVAHPTLEQFFIADEGTTVTWKLIRRKTHKVVTRGSLTSEGPLIQPVSVPVPRGLPLGKYLLRYRNAASPKSRFPYAYPVEHYRCVKTSAKTGVAIFKVPAGGPDVSLWLYLVSDIGAPSEVVEVKAGHTYRLRTSLASVTWQAVPIGNHVGNLGIGVQTVPQS